MGKINNIIEGFTKELPLDEDWYQKRIGICNSCEFNSLNGASLGIDCKAIKKVFCPSSEKGTCNKCCCCIEEKCSVKAESCPKEKWGAMAVTSDKFKLELITEGDLKYIKPSRQPNGVTIGGYYVIDVGTVISDNVQVRFDTNSLLKTYIYESSKAGCSCTTTFPEEIMKGRVYRHSVNISLSAYGQQTKNLELHFLGNNNNREAVIIKIKFNRKNTKL